MEQQSGQQEGSSQLHSPNTPHDLDPDEESIGDSEEGDQQEDNFYQHEADVLVEAQAENFVENDVETFIETFIETQQSPEHPDLYEQKTQTPVLIKKKLKTHQATTPSQIGDVDQTAFAMTSQMKRRLRRIFDFYSHQERALTLKDSPTFEQIRHKMSVMTLNKWMLFCKEFKLTKKVSVGDMHEIFKRQAQHHEFTFELFMENLMKVINTTFESLQMGLAFLQVTDEEGWRVKSTEVGMPYFEKTGPTAPLPLPVLKPKPKAHSKHFKQQKENMIKMKQALNVSTTKPKPSPIEKKVQKELQTMDQLKMQMQMSIQREEQDNIYLKEYMLSPRVSKAKSIDTDNHKHAQKMKYLNLNHNKHHAEMPPSTHVTRKICSVKLRSNESLKTITNIGQTSAGILKRLDEKINRFKKK